jgi:hypothetical protein
MLGFRDQSLFQGRLRECERMVSRYTYFIAVLSSHYYNVETGSVPRIACEFYHPKFSTWQTILGYLSKPLNIS